MPGGFYTPAFVLFSYFKATVKPLLKGPRRVTEIMTKTQRLYCTFRVTPVTLAGTGTGEPRRCRSSAPGSCTAVLPQASEETPLGCRLPPEKSRGFF